MDLVQTLGLALGAGFSSGLNLYATIATLGLLQRFGIIHLPASLQVLSHPWVLGIAIALYAIEFLADKIPYADSPTGGGAACVQRHGCRCAGMALGRGAPGRRSRADIAQRKGQHARG